LFSDQGRDANYFAEADNRKSALLMLWRAPARFNIKYGSVAASVLAPSPMATERMRKRTTIKREKTVARTDNFKKHHVEILTIAKSVKTLLISGDAAQHTAEVRQLLSQLSGKLSFHLAMEDKSLYPFLSTHADARIKALSKKYSEEMGSLAQAFRSYLDKWSNAMLIDANLEGFIGETKTVFNALVRRIQREDTELYPIVDQLPQ
jgi:hemerythrin-like domain-containing protein